MGLSRGESTVILGNSFDRNLTEVPVGLQSGLATDLSFHCSNDNGVRSCFLDRKHLCRFHDMHHHAPAPAGSSGTGPSESFCPGLTAKLNVSLRTWQVGDLLRSRTLHTSDWQGWGHSKRERRAAVGAHRSRCCLASSSRSVPTGRTNTAYLRLFWAVLSYGCRQVEMNLLDWRPQMAGKVTCMHTRHIPALS